MRLISRIDFLKQDDMMFEAEYELPRNLKDKLKDPDKLEQFSMKKVYDECILKGQKGKDAVDVSLDNHFVVIAENCEDVYDGLMLLEDLQEDIERRLKHYTKCITKATDAYLNWLKETYNRQLSQRIRAELNAE
jgi:hypothetical protein